MKESIEHRAARLAAQEIASGIEGKRGRAPQDDQFKHVWIPFRAGREVQAAEKLARYVRKQGWTHFRPIKPKSWVGIWKTARVGRAYVTARSLYRIMRDDTIYRLDVMGAPPRA